MATFTAGALGGDMMLALSWFPGSVIDQIVITDGVDDTATVTGFDFLPGKDLVITYLGSGALTTSDAVTPASGTFTSLTINFDGFDLGTLSGINRPNNFFEINRFDNARILDGNDTLNGSTSADVLFSGYGGNEVFNGNGGSDLFIVSAQTAVPTHAINGANGSTDTIFVWPNQYTSASKLDLRNSTLQSIEKIQMLGDVSTVVKSSQFGAGKLSVSSTISHELSGTGTLHVVKNLAGTLDLSALNVLANVAMLVDGTGNADTISGTKVADTFRAAAGADSVNGNGGNDVFEVTGSEALFDTMSGGAGTDRLKAMGNSALVLNGFNAASQSIEAWDGNGQGLLGNGNANVFNFAGLTSMTGLPFVDGGAGNDAMTGSKFADMLRGGFGVDTMTGGLGGDRFDFDAVKEIGKKKGKLDGITDFGVGDLIDLSTIDANGKKKGDKAFKFLKKEDADFTGKAGQLGFDQKKGATFVQGDTNGDGKADFKLQVTGKIDFEKADFVL